MDTMIKRRRLLATLCAVLVAAVAVGGYGGPIAASAGMQAAGKPYAGTTLRVLVANHPWAVAIKPLLPSFEKATGMTVRIESYGEDQLAQKLTVEFTSGSSDIDVFMQRPLQQAKLFARNGWTQDLNAFVKDPRKTPASYNFGDFERSALATESVNGQLTGIPIVVEHEVLYYRKDLLQAKHLSVPRTLSALQQDAARLTDRSKGIYGFVARGMQAQAVTQFSSFLYSFGGDWYNQRTRKATLNTPQALSAFKFYGDLLRKDGPPGVLNMSWPQAVAVFAQGKAALYTDADSLYSNLLDPSKSRVAGKTGVAPFPSGPRGFDPYSVCSWGLSINASAPHKDAAWEFVKWATSRAVTMVVQGRGAVPEERRSVYDTASGIAKFPKDWLNAARLSARGRTYDRPIVVQVGKARDIIGTVIVAAIEGKDLKSAADQANSQFQALLDSETT